MQVFGVHVDGQTQEDAGGSFPIISPIDGRQWAIAKTSPDALSAALASSARARDRGQWASMDASQRARILNRFANLIERRGEVLAKFEVLASGKTLRVTKNEANRAAAWYRFFAGAADKIYGSHVQLTATAEAKIVREPVGLVAAITPSNGPLSLGTWKVAPALAAGNVVLVKPPIEAPASTLVLAELAIEAGLPAGTFNVVPGGADIGQVIAECNDIDLLTFTGSTAVAKKIGSTVQSNMKRFVCEAGGKSAQVIFDDADLDAALVQARQGVFSNAGQSCVAGSRLIVQRSIFDSFVERLVEATGRLRVGDPLSEETHIGPLSGAAGLARVKAKVECAVEQGGKILVGGAVPEVPNDIVGGFYFAPTVISGVGPSFDIWHEEVFGPVVVVVPFDDEEEAVALANSTKYGLAASVWSRDIGRVQRLGRQLQAGTVWANTYRIMDYRMPFGGYKESGLGRENGLETLNEYVNIKTIVTESAPPVDAFAF